MALPKVYLAKSNRANPDVVSRVRQTLSELQIQIVEFTGGEFSHKPMMECERLVVVPDLGRDEIVIGKGLYDQIIKFGNDKNFDKIFVISNEKLVIKDIDDLDVIDYDDYTSHAVIEFGRNIGCGLKTYFENIYETVDTLAYKVGSGSNYYHLIGRKI